MEAIKSVNYTLRYDMKDFKKFDLNEPQETTASGDTFDSVAAPKEEPKEESLIELLESHRLSYTLEEDGETGLSLLDRLTPERDSDVSRGRDEIQLLAEEIELLQAKELSSLRDQLRQRDELIKELLDIAERHVYMHGNDDSVTDRRQTISSAKNILGI